MFSVSNVLFVLSVFVAAASAHPLGHDHVEHGALPGQWYQDKGHPAHSLFRRQDPSTPLPRVGSPEWKAKYPDPDQPLNIDEKAIPAAWINAYKSALANGLIPQIPATVIVQDQDWNQTPTYPDGFDPSGQVVCSSTVQCYNATDIHEAPDGFIGISFDDGPTDGSPLLYTWLAQNHVKATHFLIGGNIVRNPDMFLQAFRSNGDMAVHTYTHPYMTAQSDLGVLAELGWTMQVIYDSTGGRVPRYWRPPYGDADNRVRGIAEHVFGLTAVLWNQDSNDWAMPDNQTPAKIAEEMEQWFSGSKSPGLIILEHELTVDTSSVFINTTWVNVQKYKWRPASIAQLFGTDGWNYANAKDNLGPVQPVTGIETLQSVSGSASVTLPPWYSGTASTTTITTQGTDAPAPAPAPTTTDLPGAGAGGQAGNSNQPSNTKPPLTAGNPNSSPSQTAEESNTGTPDSGAIIVRPQFALSAVVAALAFAFFA